MSAFFDWIAGWLGAFLTWVFTLVKTAFAVLFDLLIDAFCSVLTAIYTAVVAIVGAIPFNSTMFNPSTYLAGTPVEVLSMLVAIRAPEAIAIVIAALGIRFALQLIPFVRLGS